MSIFDFFSESNLLNRHFPWLSQSSLSLRTRSFWAEMQLFEAVSHTKQLSLILPLLSLVLVSCERNSTPATLPPNIHQTGNEGDIPKVFQGRYSLIPVNLSTGFNIPYVIDSQTGQVWRQTIDSEHNTIVFVSVFYQNVAGAISTVPNETAQGLEFKAQAKLRPLTPEEAEEAKAQGLDPSKVMAQDKKP